MVHKYVETTPETVMSQLQMLGHAKGPQGLSVHFEMALTGRKKSSNVKTNGSL